MYQTPHKEGETSSNIITNATKNSERDEKKRYTKKARNKNLSRNDGATRRRTPTANKSRNDELTAHQRMPTTNKGQAHRKLEETLNAMQKNGVRGEEERGSI